MFSYLREIILSFQDLEWSRRQAELDIKLQTLASSNRCNESILQYLFYVRAHGRQQRENFAKLDSFREYMSSLENVKQENMAILDELDTVFDDRTIDPCRRIREITKK
jgi:hypothetical protein